MSLSLRRSKRIKKRGTEKIDEIIQLQNTDIMIRETIDRVVHGSSEVLDTIKRVREDHNLKKEVSLISRQQDSTLKICKSYDKSQHLSNVSSKQIVSNESSSIIKCDDRNTGVPTSQRNVSKNLANTNFGSNYSVRPEESCGIYHNGEKEPLNTFLDKKYALVSNQINSPVKIPNNPAVKSVLRYSKFINTTSLTIEPHINVSLSRKKMKEISNANKGSLSITNFKKSLAKDYICASPIEKKAFASPRISYSSLSENGSLLETHSFDSNIGLVEDSNMSDSEKLEFIEKKKEFQLVSDLHIIPTNEKKIICENILRQRLNKIKKRTNKSFELALNNDVNCRLNLTVENHKSTVCSKKYSSVKFCNELKRRKHDKPENFKTYFPSDVHKNKNIDFEPMLPKLRNSISLSNKLVKKAKMKVRSRKDFNKMLNRKLHGKPIENNSVCHGSQENFLFEPSLDSCYQTNVSITDVYSPIKVSKIYKPKPLRFKQHLSTSVYSDTQKEISRQNLLKLETSSLYNESSLQSVTDKKINKSYHVTQKLKTNGSPSKYSQSKLQSATDTIDVHKSVTCSTLKDPLTQLGSSHHLIEGNLSISPHLPLTPMLYPEKKMHICQKNKQYLTNYSSKHNKLLSRKEKKSTIPEEGNSVQPVFFIPLSPDYSVNQSSWQVEPQRNYHSILNTTDDVHDQSMENYASQFSEDISNDQQLQTIIEPENEWHGSNIDKLQETTFRNCDKLCEEINNPIEFINCSLSPPKDDKIPQNSLTSMGLSCPEFEFSPPISTEAACDTLSSSMEFIKSLLSPIDDQVTQNHEVSENILSFGEICSSSQNVTNVSYSVSSVADCSVATTSSTALPTCCVSYQTMSSATPCQQSESINLLPTCNASNQSYLENLNSELLNLRKPQYIDDIRNTPPLTYNIPSPVDTPLPISGVYPTNQDGNELCYFNKSNDTLSDINPNYTINHTANDHQPSSEYNLNNDTFDVNKTNLHCDINMASQSDTLSKSIVLPDSANLTDTAHSRVQQALLGTSAVSFECGVTPQYWQQKLSIFG